MALDPSQFPDDIAALKAMLIAADKHARDLDAEIETLKLTIAKLQYERFGPSSERAPARPAGAAAGGAGGARRAGGDRE